MASLFYLRIILKYNRILFYHLLPEKICFVVSLIHHIVDLTIIYTSYFNINNLFVKINEIVFSITITTPIIYNPIGLYFI